MRYIDPRTALCYLPVMVFLKIVIGLVGLGVVVFVHELGHFLVARLVGIRVEAFSIGWGKPILKKKIGDVEYRLGMFPVGGYCKMAGEKDFEKIWENYQSNIPEPKGSFLGAHPMRRIAAVAAGPLFNIIFAVFVFALIWGRGFSYETMDNRIVLASDVQTDGSYAADRAGLKTGDRILAINHKLVNNFRELQRMIAVNAERKLAVEIEREGRLMTVLLVPELQKDSGAGFVGVHPYGEPVIGYLAPDSPAIAAGLQNGDRILSINGKNMPYTALFSTVFNGKDEWPSPFEVEYQRGASTYTAEIPPPLEDSQGLGIFWQGITYHTPRYSVFGAIQKGIEEALWTLDSTIRSFRLLFRGIDLTKSVSGPARITWMVGELATEGFGQSFGNGLFMLGNFLALISIALGVTNLLPLPVLDGGSILIYLVEIIKRGPLHPRFYMVFQTMGIIIVAGLMLFSITGDLLFFLQR